jgi:hypothetical protein
MLSGEILKMETIFFQQNGRYIPMSAESVVAMNRAIGGNVFTIGFVMLVMNRSSILEDNMESIRDLSRPYDAYKRQRQLPVVRR